MKKFKDKVRNLFRGLNWWQSAIVGFSHLAHWWEKFTRPFFRSLVIDGVLGFLWRAVSRVFK